MSSKQPIIIITGAGGFVGAELVQHFAQKDWHVKALVRGAKKYKAQPNVTYVEYDLTKPFDKNIFKGAKYLVHTAYIKYDGKNPDALKLNVTAAKRLLTAARANKLAKTVFMSSMSAHDEAVSVYGRQKLAVEKLFNTSHDVVLRSGLIVGNGGIVRQMSEFMRTKHMVPLIGGGTQPLQVIAVHDLVQVIENALTRKVSGIFTVAHPHVYTYKSFYQTLAKHLGIKVLFVPIPFYLLLAVMRTIALLRLPLSVNEDNLWGLKKLRAVDNAKDLAALNAKLGNLEKALEKSGIHATKPR